MLFYMIYYFLVINFFSLFLNNCGSNSCDRDIIIYKNNKEFTRKNNYSDEESDGESENNDNNYTDNEENIIEIITKKKI